MHHKSYTVEVGSVGTGTVVSRLNDSKRKPSCDWTSYGDALELLIADYSVAAYCKVTIAFEH